MYLIHYQIQKLAGHSLMPGLWSLLLQGTEFIKFYIMGNFNAMVGCIPGLVSLGSQFVTNEDHFSALWLEFMFPLF